jgi:hypothetical protein
VVVRIWAKPERAVASLNDTENTFCYRTDMKLKNIILRYRNSLKLKSISLTYQIILLARIRKIQCEKFAVMSTNHYFSGAFELPTKTITSTELRRN